MFSEKTNNPILLVEDNPIDLDLTLRAFAAKKLSNPIQVARDGEEALKYMEQWEHGEPWPVVILLDLNLPKINGLEVLQVKPVNFEKFLDVASHIDLYWRVINRTL